MLYVVLSNLKIFKLNYNILRAILVVKKKKKIELKK